MIKLMDKENTFMLKEPPIKEDGTKTNKKDKAVKNGQTDLIMKVVI